MNFSDICNVGRHLFYQNILYKLLLKYLDNSLFVRFNLKSNRFNKLKLKF